MGLAPVVRDYGRILTRGLDCLLGLLRERFLPIYGSGQNIRAWIFVDENCRAIHMVMEKGEKGQVYNIG